MTEKNPTLFDNNENEQGRAERIADLNEIIAQRKAEEARMKAQSQSYMEARAKQDQQRIERAAEQGVDLTSHQQTQREINRRGIEKARQRLSEIDPPPEV